MWFYIPGDSLYVSRYYQHLLLLDKIHNYSFLTLHQLVGVNFEFEIAMISKSVFVKVFNIINNFCKRKCSGENEKGRFDK